ncbi:hypothetical protein Scep_011666 [Stephania cephalantha]|uniref:Uncharacterized protein n=1 Tax=Stephania cephalantha TaxID=152367 RepID=A0AAP0JFK1_9MAGN
MAGTVIRRSTAWSRGNPRVCYAFVLIHRVNLADDKFRCRVVASRRRGDPKLSQGYMTRAMAGGESRGSNGGGKRSRAWRKMRVPRRMKCWATWRNGRTRDGEKGGAKAQRCFARWRRIHEAITARRGEDRVARR